MSLSPCLILGYSPLISLLVKRYDIWGLGKYSIITFWMEIVSTGARGILIHWRTEVKRGVGIKRAEQLFAAAEASIGLTEGITAARLELSFLLAQYDLFELQLETTMEKVMEILEKIPGAAQMLTIPGIGAITVAGFLAEVGDVNNYDHGQQIIRLAGLNLKENSSGKRKGKTGITKRGRSRLRALLFRAMLPMVAHNEAFKALHKYYTKRNQNPLKKKQSIIALCGKLIRILHTLGEKHREYNANDVLGPTATSTDSRNGSLRDSGNPKFLCPNVTRVPT